MQISKKNKPRSETMTEAQKEERVVAIQLALAELAEAQSADSLNNQLAIAELAEAILGGES